MSFSFVTLFIFSELSFFFILQGDLVLFSSVFVVYYLLFVGICETPFYFFITCEIGIWFVLLDEMLEIKKLV